jgi:benzoyl-CoA reductase/2-hydroxyglutaryl-CoA dehydratase subunit BcrC/BadD/HgdB
MADDFRVDGVVALTIRNCAPYIYDMALWKDKMEEKGIPVLDLSIEYGSAASGQIKTRVEAFIEMLI